VEDTIGAGDSFLAALISGLLSSGNHNDSLSYACAIGAIVSGYKGANPEISSLEIENMMRSK
jgi:fructokinase